MGYDIAYTITFSSSEVDNSQDKQGTVNIYSPSDTTPTIKDYFQANLPDKYSMSYDDSNFEAEFLYNGEELGYLSFYNYQKKARNPLYLVLEAYMLIQKTKALNYMILYFLHLTTELCNFFKLLFL